MYYFQVIINKYFNKVAKWYAPSDIHNIWTQVNVSVLFNYLYIRSFTYYFILKTLPTGRLVANDLAKTVTSGPRVHGGDAVYNASKLSYLYMNNTL